MKIFLDTADAQQIARWLDTGLVDGVTTNPTILKKAGVGDVEETATTIAKLIGERPLSVEVTTDDPEEMIQQAKQYASWARNIVVKIPVETAGGRPCFDVIHHLECAANIRVNTTAILSMGQAILAAKAQSSYISIFWGRVADEGHDLFSVVESVDRWLARWESSCRIIVGSMRGTIDLQRAAEAGGHILTIPPELLEKWADHQYTRATVQQFVRDAQAVRSPTRVTGG